MKLPPVYDSEPAAWTRAEIALIIIVATFTAVMVWLFL